MKLLFKQSLNKSTLLWFLAFCFGVFLTLNKNSKNTSGIGNYQSEFWADKGGYYIYLPWAVNAGFDAAKLPQNIEKKCGDSFEIEGDNVKSKYMIGVALLQSPFYILAHAHAHIIYENPTGFEKTYANWMGVGSVFYLILGLYFSFRLIRKLFDGRIAVFAVLVILAGSNLLYYSIDETMMSHVYGFSMIALLNWFVIGEKTNNKNWGVLLVLIIALFLLRPTSIFYVLLLLIFYRKNLSVPAVTNLNVIYVFGSIILVALQVLYWYVTFGAFIPAGYANEGFTNLLSPSLLLVLFSPNNGWLPYSLVFGLIIIVSIGFIHRMNDKKIVTLTLLTFFSMIYITASWWTYDFGCGMGVRNLIDFSSLWMLYVGVFYDTIKNNQVLVYSLSFLLLIICLLNLNLTYSYDNCYFGKGNWDWDFYFEKLLP